MCSGCSGGYQDDYEDPEGYDLDQENHSDTAGALDNPTDGPTGEPASRPVNGRERIDGERGEHFRDFGTDESQQGRIVGPFEEGYEVLVGVDRILEIRIVRAKPAGFGELAAEESPSRRHGVREKSHKHYQTYAIGHPPYLRLPGRRLFEVWMALLIGPSIQFWFWGLAAFSVGALAAWIFLQ